MKKFIGGLFSLVLVIGIVFFIRGRSLRVNEKDPDLKYVNGFDSSSTVSKVNNQILRPYTDSNVKIIDGFYDYKGSEKDQEKSIISYESTYMQNSGVIYGNDNLFDVICVYDGVADVVKNDKLLGNYVIIRHNDRVSSIYYGLSSISVKAGDSVTSGSIIGKSGESNFNKFNHLMFEIKVDGKFIDPESAFGKDISEI